MNHVLAAIIALILAAPVSALAQPPVLNPDKTVVVAVEVLADGVPITALPADVSITYSASSSEALAMRWCAPGLPSPAACSIVNAKSAFLLTRSAEAYGRILPTASLTGNTIFVNLRRGSATIDSREVAFEIAGAATPTPTVTPEPAPTSPPSTPVYSLGGIVVTQ